MVSKGSRMRMYLHVSLFLCAFVLGAFVAGPDGSRMAAGCQRIDAAVYRRA